MPEETKEGGNRGRGQPMYQQKGKGAAAGQQQTMQAGPSNAWQGNRQGANQQLNLNNRPVPAATEEGFTGPTEGWFDGKFAQQHFVLSSTFARQWKSTLPGEFYPLHG